MQVEIRKSGGEPCPRCGANELITTTDGEPLSAVLDPAINSYVAEIEARLIRAGEEGRVSDLAALGDALASLPDARWYRLWKRRWQRDMHATLDGILADLQDRTARA